MVKKQFLLETEIYINIYKYDSYIIHNQTVKVMFINSDNSIYQSLIIKQHDNRVTLHLLMSSQSHTI